MPGSVSIMIFSRLSTWELFERGIPSISYERKEGAAEKGRRKKEKPMKLQKDYILLVQIQRVKIDRLIERETYMTELRVYRGIDSICNAKRLCRKR